MIAAQKSANTEGPKSAGSPHGPWRMSNSPALAMALPNAYLRSLRLPSLAPAKTA